MSGSLEYSYAYPDGADDWQHPPLDGDYYRQEDDVSRGLTITDVDFSGGLHLGDGCGAGCDFTSKFSNEFDLSMVGYSSGLSQNTMDDTSEDRFQAGDVPPQAPQDEYFNFEATTLFAAFSGCPSRLGNTILDLLSQEEANAAITKVRRSKFSIKASLFEESMMCTVKIRVYMQERDRYAVEFQRRSGDPISFNNAFAKARQYLSLRDFGVKPCSQVVIRDNASHQPQLLECQAVESDIAPILDMAGEIGETQLQAEAAVFLSDMAAEGQQCSLTMDVFCAIKSLMQNNDVEVAVPTASLVLNLARISEVAPHFAHSGLLQQIMDQVAMRSVHAQIRRRLVQALRIAIDNLSERQAALAGELDLANFSPTEFKAKIEALLRQQAAGFTWDNEGKDVTDNLQCALSRVDIMIRQMSMHPLLQQNQSHFLN